MLTEIRTRSQITIPAEIIKKLDLKQGDTLEVDIQDNSIILRPVIAVPKEQSYFWSKEWQQEEKQVQADIIANKVIKAETLDTLFEELEI